MAQFPSARTRVEAVDLAPGDPEQQLGDPVEVARLICLNQLTARPRSRAELSATLSKRGIPPEAAEEVLERLTEVGLIDDAAFAELWVRSRQRERGLASSVLRQELARKGVAAEVVSGALEQLEPGQEAAAARALIQRKLLATRGLPLQTRMRRLVSMLARKGYASGLAFAVVREAIEAEGLSLDPSFVALESGQD